MKSIVAWDRMAALLQAHRALVSRTPDLRILAAADTAAALELHREHRARLLILDTRMPGEPLDELCRAVRADPELRQVSVIVIGSAASLPLLKRCAANRSFVRPVDQEDFLGAVRSLINVAARKDYRVLVGLEVSGVVHGGHFFGRSENLSVTGILFSTGRRLEVGDRPSLSFVLPGQGQLHVQTEVVRVEAQPGKDARYGARFVDPSLQARQMLEAFQQTRLFWTRPAGERGRGGAG